MDRLMHSRRCSSGRRLRAAWLMAVMLAAPAAHSGAQAVRPIGGPLTEYEVKAAFLLNFARFVTFPASDFADAASPLSICLLGHDPVDAALEQLVAGETINGRHVVVHRLNSAPEPKACEILFVGNATGGVAALLQNLGPGVLTVGDEPGFLRAGGIIQFAIDNRHVRFDISQRAATRSALTLSARLLAVARSVQKE